MKFQKKAGTSKGNNRGPRNIRPWLNQQPQQLLNSDQFLLYPGQNGVIHQQLIPQQQLHSYQKSKTTNRRFVHHLKYPFVALPDGADSFSVEINPKNLTCFHGSVSVFTLQHKGDNEFVIDGASYKSVDQYYQIRKVKDLLGLECEKFTDGTHNNYSGLARDLLRTGNVSRDLIDKWRVTCGVEVIQKGILEKVRQSPVVKGELIKTGSKLIAHTYTGDDFFGTSVPAKYISDWCKGMEEKKTTMNFPATFPLTAETLKHIPIIGKGRNVLGVIYMLLREKINKAQLDNLSVNLSQFETKPSDGVKPATGSAKPAGSLAKPQNGNITKSSISQSMDFTADA